MKTNKEIFRNFREENENDNETLKYFNPKEFNSLNIYYSIVGGQKQTQNDPGIQPSVEFEDFVIFNDMLLPKDISYFLIEEFGGKWEKEILNEVWY